MTFSENYLYLINVLLFSEIVVKRMKTIIYKCIELRKGINDMILEPPEIRPFGFGEKVFNEGDYASTSCSVSKGDLPLKITWSLQGVARSSNHSSQLWDMADGIVTNPMGRRASFLSIESVGYGHTGIYTCTARNAAGNSSYSTELKVNG